MLGQSTHAFVILEVPANCPPLRLYLSPSPPAVHEGSISLLQLRLPPELRGSTLFHTGPRSFAGHCFQTLFWKTDLWKNGLNVVLIYISHMKLSIFLYIRKPFICISLWTYFFSLWAYNLTSLAHFSIGLFFIFLMVYRSFLYF